MRAMKDPDYTELRKVLNRHIKDLQNDGPEYQSTHWFLLRYMRRIRANTEKEDPRRRVESSVRAFIRFYLDRVEEQSDLGMRCRDIMDTRRKLLLGRSQTPPTLTK